MAISILGVGGVFVMKSGAALHHVQSNCTQPLDTPEKKAAWFKYHDMPAPLVSLGMFMTGALDVGLRQQHFHSFSNTTVWGGHYYNDTTPDIVEYEGYFNIAKRAIRIDRPT